MTAVLCMADGCGRPVPDNAYICPRCAEHLERALGDVTAVVDEFNPPRYPDDDSVPEYLRGKVHMPRDTFGRQPSTVWDAPTAERGNLPRELETTRYRQATTGRNGGKAAETPVPWDQRAREAAWVLENAISTWARVIEEERGKDLPEDTSTASLARWMLGSVEWLRHHQAGAEALDEITSAVANAAHAVDIRPERWYAGPCDTCGTDLYGKPASAHVICPNDECGQVYDVKQRREQLLAAAEDRLANAALISRAVTSLGEPVKADRIRQWASRGRIVAHSVDLKGRPLYRIGDVLDLVAEDVDRNRLTKRGA